MIVSGIIDPASMPQPIVEPKPIAIQEPKPKTVRKPRPKAVRPTLSAEEKIKIRDNKYKDLIAKETDGKVRVILYRGATEKADYKSNVCGHTWSTRPDHFKHRQNYRCPICSSEDSTKK